MMEPTKPTTIAPAVGRICHFIRFDAATFQHAPLPEAAIITAVHNLRSIGCHVFGAGGRVSHFTSIELVQPGDVAPDRDYCRWMEYQIGQAVKANEYLGKMKELELRATKDALLDGKADAEERDAKSGV